MATKQLSDCLHSISTSTSSFTRATQHPFLTAAGDGSLSASTLTRWLVQDIHYTRAYIRFIGGLLSQLYLPTSLFRSTAHGGARQKDLQARIFDLLTGALTNIQRETQFFEDVAEEYGLSLDLTAEPEPITRAYINMFDSMRQGSGRGGLLEGLTVLWATEECYLNAWNHAKKQTPHKNFASTKTAEKERVTMALRAEFIPNWTSAEFVAFVDECKGVLDAAAGEEGLGAVLGAEDTGRGVENNAKMTLKRCERIWEQVLWLEERFWPDV